MLYKDQIYFETDCTSCSFEKWEKLMNQAVKANGKRIKSMIKKQLPDLYHALYLEFPNHFEHRSKRTQTHYIYVHSGIEYFLARIPNH